MSKNIVIIIGLFTAIVIFFAVYFTGYSHGPQVFGIRAEFLLFALTLVGVALLHHHTLEVAVAGLISVLILKFAFTDFHLGHHLAHEWNILVNLLGLLLGFAILAKHFEESKLPELLPRFLPRDWKGGMVLLFIIFVMSSFLDNIAAAMIGGTIAMVVFKGRVDIGFLAAIVAASNAGGSGSVVGDTTTTMMWIDGVSPFDVLHAYAAAFPALIFFSIFAAKQQHKFQPIQFEHVETVMIDWKKIAIVILILVGAIAANVFIEFPAAGVWAAILIGATFSKTAWHELPGALKGSLFLLSLVLIASMMPVDQLPAASWQSAFSLGFISAIFDNIPLTKLALDQGGYDWGALAYSVGYGGSMIWFGSSAGVALSNMFPHARNVGLWLKFGWHVAVAYIIGFFILLLTFGWHPHAPHKEKANAPVIENVH
jgi:Na+/H+ antiporter NhaD/arsenite permease-like protein